MKGTSLVVKEELGVGGSPDKAAARLKWGLDKQSSFFDHSAFRYIFHCFRDGSSTVSNSY